MSTLTDFLHKLVDHIGASSLHADVDRLAKDETETAVKDVATDVETEIEGKEETPNAPE